MTDASGAVVERRLYDDYGRSYDGTSKAPVSGSAVGNVYGFQGRRLDPETGLYYFRARYYDPETGRFVQRDPVWDPGNFGNQYSFVGGGPVSGRDPGGLLKTVRTKTGHYELVTEAHDSVYDLGKALAWDLPYRTAAAGLRMHILPPGLRFRLRDLPKPSNAAKAKEGCQLLSDLSSVLERLLQETRKPFRDKAGNVTAQFNEQYFVAYTMPGKPGRIIVDTGTNPNAPNIDPDPMFKKIAQVNDKNGNVLATGHTHPRYGSSTQNGRIAEFGPSSGDRGNFRDLSTFFPAMYPGKKHPAGEWHFVVSESGTVGVTIGKRSREYVLTDSSDPLARKAFTPGRHGLPVPPTYGPQPPRKD